MVSLLSESEPLVAFPSTLALIRAAMRLEKAENLLGQELNPASENFEWGAFAIWWRRAIPVAVGWHSSRKVRQGRCRFYRSGPAGFRDRGIYRRFRLRKAQEGHFAGRGEDVSAIP